MAVIVMVHKISLLGLCPYIRSYHDNASLTTVQLAASGWGIRLSV